MGNEAGLEVREMIRSDKELSMRDRKAELGLHCQNLKVGDWTVKGGLLGVVYLVVETTVVKKNVRAKTHRGTQGLGDDSDLQEFVV